ncbi:hypothetical protein E1301_Tti023213 [Triplophysa tibetana]|uniref:Uncharacterized protein n=1 Tax=Triplophysa tibetana TaxID=1572043 RepID=A0A5A9PHQ0_9TELE|nr:hypothetical protein E1301_Tti023213 [Triplophysa tibetana]
MAEYTIVVKVDGIAVCQCTSIDKAFITAFSMYFAFNIAYPVHPKNTLTFLQRRIVSIVEEGKAPASNPASKICLAHHWAAYLLQFWPSSGWVPGPKKAQPLKMDTTNFLWAKDGPHTIKLLLHTAMAQIWLAQCKVTRSGPGMAQTLCSAIIGLVPGPDAAH